MKIRSGYMLRKVMDMTVIMSIGSETYTPNQIMSLNETGAFLWEKLEKGADKQVLVDSLVADYEIDNATADSDVDEFLNQLREKGLIEEGFRSSGTLTL